jgi:hypothetical protein
MADQPTSNLENRMRIRTVAILALTAAALAPDLACAADAERKAVLTCADAFAKSLNRRYRLVYEDAGSAQSPFYSSYSFDLKARDTKTGNKLGKATCIASRAGDLIELRPASY